jgi:hypothetical protein
MSTLSEDLTSFLEVVEKVASPMAEGAGGLSDASGTLAETGLLDLAQDTADEPDSLHWLTHTVRVASQSSPSLGFVLAARYAADRVLGERAATTAATFCLSVGGSRPVVPTALDPESVVVLETDEAVLRTVRWADMADSAQHEARSGLRGSGLATVVVPMDAPAVDSDVREAMRDWDLLTGAAFVGITRRAVASTSQYVLERHQFGVPIGSFAGLRALVAGMTLKAEGLQALLEASAEHGSPSESVSAVAGRAAVDICIDAIQAHGGYGYIDEYPLAGLLRDAISLQARAGGRRLHVARVAERRLGRREGVRA